MGLPIAEDPDKNRAPVLFSEIIEKAWGDWKIGSSNTPESILSENWGKLVSFKLSLKCAPERIDTKRKILFVRCSNAAVKQELSFIKKNILKRISALEGDLEIKDIKYH